MEEQVKDKTLIRLKRKFTSPVKPLFEAFLSAEEFREWFSPPGFEAGNFTIDPVVGGDYNCEFLKQNVHVLTIKGKYIIIERYKKISFTLMYDPDVSSIGQCNVHLIFDEKEDHTEIILLQEIYRTIDAEGRTKGWEFMFTNLENILTDKKNN